MGALDTPDGRFVAQEMAKIDLGLFKRYMFRMRKGYRAEVPPYDKFLCNALMRVFRGECRRLIINIPPRYFKTETAVKAFIPFCLGHAPDAEFIHTSYAHDLARSNTWEAREIVQHEAYRAMFPATVVDTRIGGADDWRTTAGGVVYARQMGGSITGFGAGKMRPGFGGALIIDDPHKADDVRHDALRRIPIHGYQNTLQSRLNDPVNTPVIVIMQRLHEEDLTGWMLAGGTGEQWEILCLPALCESEDDPLGRAIGEPLWAEKHTAEMLRVMERHMPMVFAGQYQQRPAPAEGLMFKPDRLVVVDSLAGLRIKRWVRGWDKASTAGGGDWTAGIKLGELEDGRLIIGDVERFQGGPDEVASRIKSTAERDGQEVWIDLPQDPGAAGKIVKAADGRLLKGYVVGITPELGSKEDRAAPFAAQVNLGNVLMIRADWNAALVHEMRQFPNGKHDDQVDGLSRAFGRLVTDTSGDSIFPVSALLVEGLPALDPSHCQTVFCTIASSIQSGKPHDAIAAIYWALDKTSGASLVVLDWEIQQIGGDWVTIWLPAVVERCKALARAHFAHFGFSGLWIENRGSGVVLLEQGKRQGWPAKEIDTKLVQMGTQEKAVSVAGYVAANKIKLTALAYERTSTYRGLDRNHLIDQIRCCRIGAKTPIPEEELLKAFLDGAMIALGDRRGW